MIKPDRLLLQWPREKRLGSWAVKKEDGPILKGICEI